MKNKTEKLKKDFTEYLRDGAKSPEDWRVGIEIELFCYDFSTKERLNSQQVEAVLRGLAKRYESELLIEDNLTVETYDAKGGKFTVEPGGQIEFSSQPRRSLSEIEIDLQTVFADLRKVGADLNFRFLAVGFDPLRRLKEQNWFEKPRYRLMKPYLAQRGTRAWDMMTRTCSVQVNLDYSDEQDLIKKFTVGNRLAPVVAAIFANSPFVEGKANGLKSNRATTWLETDSDRCGVSTLVVRDEFSLDDFVEYSLDVPILFVRRNGRYLRSFTGRRFRNFLANTEIEPTLQDFQDHLTAIFTEARLKNYIEMRSADCGDLQHALAVAALWKGLLYDEQSLDEAFKIAPKMSAAGYCRLHRAAAENGLQAISDGVSVLDLAKKIVRLAVEGLNRIAPEETKYLNVLLHLVLFEEKSPADVLLENWNNSIETVLELTQI